MRINQYIAAASHLSRRAADTAIAQRRVRLNGQIASLGQTVPTGARIELDGRVLTPTANYTYLMLHKPTGYISSRTQQGNTPTLYSLLPNEHHRLRIAGRLDQDSSGLILLSDDGAFIQRQTHPSFGKLKRYELTLSHPLTAADRQSLEAGVRLTDGLSRLTVTKAQGKNVTVTLGEGRNRQLRRTFGALGYGIERLHRTELGPYKLGDLAPGGWQVVAGDTPL